MKIHCLSPFQHHPSTKILFASGPMVTATAVSARLQPSSSLIGFNTTDMVMLFTLAEKKPAIIEIPTMTQL
jgi:hypothetical protein